jgi:hypothetical protein
MAPACDFARVDGAFLCFAAGLIVVLSGCTSPAASSSKDAADDGGSIVATTGRDARVVVGEKTGAVVGSIHDDIGVAVSTAHVVLARDIEAYSNRTGSFALSNVTAGTYTVRVEHPDYRTTEEPITIHAGEVTHLEVTLVPRVNAGAGYRPHLHDYWADRREVPVIDKSFDWHEPYDRAGPEAQTFSRVYDQVTQTEVNPCIFQGKPYFNNRFIWFDDGAQLVWAGTSKIVVKLDWTQSDYSGDSLAIAWKTPVSNDWQMIDPMIKKGAEATIEVASNESDSSHQAFTLWQFVLCINNSTSGTIGVAPVTGSIHVSMKIVRGREIMPEPPHPYFWANGTTFSALPNSWNNFTMSNNGYTLGRSAWGSGNAAFAVAPPPKDKGLRIVPPGTKELHVHLEWKYSLPSGTKAWSLTYRPANVHPYSSADPATLKVIAPANKGPTSRDYVIPVGAAETDAFYQHVTNWLFFLNYEGEESDWKWVEDCGCDIAVHTTVFAIKDPSFDKGPTA